ncbi:hypothetical protein [Rhizobium leguminosarum]|uniref:hypothetical protein n=1 Tax=Rhizobium leguminosarum TaxID=384 RepID=UPI0010326EB8|nr:hypothetical protein [Rhizobium leguminosarum]TBH55053.1 hypothetical protein ELG62_16465 [Rhizobium leguminosarum]
MSLSEKFIVLPFKRVRGNLTPGEMRQASNPAAAERIAEALADRVVGVAAYSVMVDLETGDMTSPRVLCRFGETAEIAA